MKKALSKNISSSSKIVRRIFRNNSSSTKLCDGTKIKNSKSQTQMTDDSYSQKEIEALRDQVANLKAAVTALQLESENKEIKLAKIARDKEKLTMDLLKIKRSNNNLVQQLEDERNFYFKEKEAYCQEMADFKKLKKALSNSNLTTQIDNGEEIAKLKKKLEQTLEMNYNLSIRFLRMKESKTKLRESLRKAEMEYKKLTDDLKMKIDILGTELNDVLELNFEHPMSPSNKKYLQLVNQNSSLVYENLCLQLQIDQLHLKIRKDKIHRTKSETDTRTTKTKKKAKSRSRNSTKSSKVDRNEKIIKIYEREQKPGVPTVTILNENEISCKKKCNSDDKLQLPEKTESKLTVFQVSEIQSRTSTESFPVKKQRSKSAPKIVQSTLFKSAKAV